MYSFEKPGVNLKTVYVIEYVANTDKWKRVCDGKHPAPWELYERRTIDNLPDAINGFAIMTARMERGQVFDVHLCEVITLDGEIIREQTIDEFPGLRNMIDAETSKRTNRARQIFEENKDLQIEARAVRRLLDDRVWDSYAEKLNEYRAEEREKAEDVKNWLYVDTTA